MSEEKLSKSQLLAAIHSERVKLEKLFSQFLDEQKTEPIFENGWSIKDLMAHIAAWEQIGYDIIQPAKDGKPLKAYVAKVFESVDNFNAGTYEKNKDKPLSEIDAEYQTAFKDFVALVEPLDEAFIASNLPFEDAQEFSIQFIISANTHFHYRKHAEVLEKWLVTRES